MDANVSVVGGGYVGLVSSACLSELGCHVSCIEVDPTRLQCLLNGEVPIHEPHLDELIVRGRDAGRLVFTGNYAEVIPSSQMAFIAVNTPAGANGNADTRFVFSAVRSVLRYARQGMVIVMKSTVPVGTSDKVAELAGRLVPGVRVVSNPEFLKEGSAVEDFMRPDRIVIGSSDPAAGGFVASLYSDLQAPIIFCRRRSAELAKYAANALLATRISFMNEIALVCQSAGADIHEVERAVGSDRRIGPSFLRAGLGWGGSCFPKDLQALAATAKAVGARTAIVEAAIEANSHQREVACNYLEESLSQQEKPVVGVLGLAFKPNTDDIRESPALGVIGRMLEIGMEIRAHDPIAMDNARMVFPQVTYCPEPYDVACGADALFLATEWPQYQALDWSRMLSVMRGKVIVDGRNVLDCRPLLRLGFSYHSFGRHVVDGDGTE